MHFKRINIIIFSVLALLSVPLVAMQFTSEVNWDLFDFIVMGILLFAVGLSIDFVLQKAKSLSTQLLLCGVILLLFFLVYAELAVGIFGTPFAGS